jgi:hypothetical protein
MKPTNVKLRIWNMALLWVVVLSALIAWMFMGRDPGLLTGLVATVGISQGALEAGNIGKRATFKKEAVDAEIRTT